MHRRALRLRRFESPSKAEVAAENELALGQARPSCGPRADVLSWEKTKAEFGRHTMLGPHYDLGALPPGDPRCLNRFAVLEMHGGAVEESCRNIDDGNVRGYNLIRFGQHCHTPPSRT